MGVWNPGYFMRSDAAMSTTPDLQKPSPDPPPTKVYQPQIACFGLGPWMTNCYVVAPPPRQDKKTRPCWIIDAGMSPEPMIQYMGEQNLDPQQILLTHAHIDHIAGLSAMRTIWAQMPILVHEAEADFLTDPQLNLSGLFGMPVITPAPTGELKHGQSLTLGPMQWQVRYTPGHSPGSVTFYHASSGVAIDGDTLFAGSIGRYDFPTSDGRLLRQSIQTQLLTLPDETCLYPGHGPGTTVGRERASNPYLQ